ncbi:MAG: hypothetical protein H6585_02925 [Flavobacteriales bacterium]|nr:hypothetical protein [Flavobacteriales bacterium]MCB9447280.1 hypothetical protein [Flavobacteriales bacterium]
MPTSDLTYFDLLKQEIEATFRSRHPACTDPLPEWKGQDIVDFQEDLRTVAGGSISEKWFYTHMKNRAEALPRIDMLNMLSKYAGHESWKAFCYKADGSGTKEEVAAAAPPPEQPATPSGKSKKKRSRMAILMVILAAALSPVWMKKKPKVTACTFCFVEHLRNVPASAGRIELLLLSDGESPRRIQVDASGCVSFDTEDERVRFVVQSPYYKTDTIERVLHRKTDYREKFSLRPNDYAMMIHYLSTSNTKDWKKRRAQLMDMIAEDARILQVVEDGNHGIELYNREEFVNKLTLPVKSLRNIEVIESTYKGDKISFLRFIQNHEGHE